jgi:hypothetical protein
MIPQKQQNYMKVADAVLKSATSSTLPTNSIDPIVFKRESSSRVRIVNSERGG